VTVQRAIEMLGIPTVGITVEPEETRQARPPRSLCPAARAGAGLEFSVGRTMGRAGDAALQKAILRDALTLLTIPGEPGRMETKEYA
jgi:hypothetical protein